MSPFIPSEWIFIEFAATCLPTAKTWESKSILLRDCGNFSQLMQFQYNGSNWALKLGPNLNGYFLADSTGCKITKIYIKCPTTLFFI